VGAQGALRRLLGFGVFEGERTGTAEVPDVCEPLGMDAGLDDPATEGDDDTGVPLEGAEPAGLDDAGGWGVLDDGALGDTELNDGELGDTEPEVLDAGAGAGVWWCRD
jgi:hypothetical protein